MLVNKDTFDNTINIRKNKIHFRKWKVKDRTEFLKALSTDELNVESAQEALVYNCLENDKIALSTDEFRFVLNSIRMKSLGKDIEFTLTCPSCSEPYDKTIGLDEILKPIDSEYKLIRADDVTIQLGEIPNKPFYDKKIEECVTDAEVYIIDFLYRIKSVSGDESFTFDELQEYFDNMEVDTLDKILDEWDKMKFRIDDLVKVTCPKCNTEETYSFDEIPGFFPESWFGR